MFLARLHFSISLAQAQSRVALPSAASPSLMSRMPSQAFSSDSLEQGHKVLQHQQVKTEADSELEAMRAEIKDLLL